MSRVFEAQNQAEAGYVCGLLRAEGIAAELRGDTLFAFVGAGTQVPGILPSVWTLDDRDDARARELIACFHGAIPAKGTAWSCPACGEAHEPQFGACWKCGAERPTKSL